MQLVRSAPLVWWVLGERVRGSQWLAIAIAAVGLVLVLEPWAMRGSAFSNLLAMIRRWPEFRSS